MSDFWQELERRRPEPQMALGLERITAALEQAGRPDLAVPTVLIAGTNGKGSTVCFLEHYLRRAGLRVGSYLSPHLEHPRERIRIDGVPVAADLLEAVLRRWIARMPELTWFELFTVAAWELFADAAPDRVILEVGLGGRLDATNAAGRVELTAITSIGVDHTELLGDGLAAIAGEKAGILRPDVPCVLGPMPDEARAAIAARAAPLGAELRMPTAIPWSWDGPSVLVDNLGVAHRLAEVLLGQVPSPDPADLEARPPGRWWRWSDAPLRVVDGAHNPAGAAALAAALAPHAPLACWLQVGRSKDVDGILRALAPLVEAWCFIEPPAAEAGAWWSPDELRSRVAACSAAPVQSLPVEAAVAAFAGSRGPACWTGSLRALGRLKAVQVPLPG